MNFKKDALRKPKDSTAAVLFIRHAHLVDEDKKRADTKLSEKGIEDSKKFAVYYSTLSQLLSEEFNPYQTNYEIVYHGAEDIRTYQTANLLFPSYKKVATSSLDRKFLPPLGVPEFMEKIKKIEELYPSPEQRRLRDAERIKFLLNEYEKPNHGVWGQPSNGKLFQPIEECLMNFDRLIKERKEGFRIFIGSEPVSLFYFALIAKLPPEIRTPASGIGPNESVIYYLKNSESGIEIVDLQRIIPK